MGPLVVVVVQIAIQVFLHLFNRLIPGRSAHHPEVLVQQGAVQAFDFLFRAAAIRLASSYEQVGVHVLTRFGAV